MNQVEPAQTGSGAVTVIDHIGAKYLQYLEKARALKTLQDEVNQMEREIREVVGNAEAATFHGTQVITNKPVNRLRGKDFAADNPTLNKQYTVPKLVDVLDTDALRRDHPNLYAQYQSRQFKFLEIK